MTATSDRERERVWELHTTSEFSTLDLDTTMATMSDDPEVVHVPTAMGARGRASVRHFYRRWFVGHHAADFALAPLTRTTGRTRIVDEMLVSFTHDVEVPWILPGVPPTGRRVEIPVIAVVSFDGALISGEHIYWDLSLIHIETATGQEAPHCHDRSHVSAATAVPGSEVQPALGSCWVEQWIPPPPSPRWSTGTGTTFRPGYSSRSTEAALLSAFLSPKRGMTTPPLTT